MASRLEAQQRWVASIGDVHTGEDGFPYEAKLVQVDISSGTDKFFNIQLLKAKDSSGYLVYTEWGQTGMDGQMKLIGEQGISKSKAVEEFDKVYTEKTGNSWAGRMIGAEAESPDLYQHLSTVTRNQPRTEVARWEYYLKDDHHLNGAKPDGWYAYDKASGEEVEELYMDGQDNGSLMTRFVHSTSSGYTYRVNLNSFQQTNTKSNKTRPIRRICGNSIITHGKGDKTGGSKRERDAISATRVRNKKQSSSSSSVTKKKTTSSTGATALAAPKKKTKAKSSRNQAEEAEEVVVVAVVPSMTLNLRQQYVKGLLSDRSARKYLKSLGRSREN